MCRLNIVLREGTFALAIALCFALALAGCTNSSNVVLTTPLSISTTALPSGQVSTAYSASLAASGGTAPLSWSITGGTLPAGLSLSASGVISGTPTAAVSGASITFAVQDSGSPAQVMSATLVLTIAAAPLSIPTTSLPNGSVGVLYSASVVASGGTPPLSWSISAGALPAGLSLSASGVISGTPTAPVQNGSITFLVRDSGAPAQMKSATLVLTIAPAPLSILTTSLPSGMVGVAYNATLGAGGGTLPFSWSISGGTVPAGLSLSAAGVISGTPTTAVSNTSVTFLVRDSGSPAQTKSAILMLTIAPALLSIPTTALPNGMVGVPYNASIVAAGGTTPYAWSISSGALPAGLSLSAAGLISGTPTAPAQNSSITFLAQDSGSPMQTKSVTLALTIAPAPLTILTTLLPQGMVGVPYNASVVASGGTIPFTWSISSGTLPAGLSLSAAGVISGTPTVAVANASITFLVRDSGSPAQTKSVTLALTIDVRISTLTITTTSLPGGTVGAAYNTVLSANGGVTPYSWSVTSGTLPAGLSLAAATGVISGTPTAAVSGASITFSVQDSESPAQTTPVTLTLTIAPPTLVVTTTSLPNGTVGTAYSATLAATGGTTPYTWSITSGALPAGLSLAAATGVISGTPTMAVSGSSITFSAQDSGSPAQTAPVTLTLTIAPPALNVTTTSLPGGTVGAAYSVTLAATGGTTPYAWSITSGALPSGLSLAGTTGVISGTPTMAVSGSSITFSVQDSESPAQNKAVALTLTIASPVLTVTTTSLPSGTVGAAYSKTLAATGGTTPYSWSITNGALPAGLSLAATTGVISGTPTVAVSGSSITFAVTDSESPTVTKTAVLTITIAPPVLSITTTSLPNGAVGTAYSATLSATGGTPPYSWSITNGALPAGLSLAASTGVISGTPTVAISSSSITFSAQDSGSPAQSKTVTLTLTIASSIVTITTTSLPNGTVGTAYSATLAASGGTTPYSWSIISGALPAGLSLAASTGVLSGTPSASALNTPIGFEVQDSANPANTKTTTLNLTINTTAVISVTLNLQRAGLTVTQLLALSATTNDPSGVSWGISPSGGSFSANTSASGIGITLTAPSSPGSYVVTATSVSDNTKSSSATIGVTDLAGVYSYHNDLNRDGANVREYALTTANVATATFGKLFSCVADGAVYAQPLWAANLNVSGVQRNAVFVATAHDGLFAFDADVNPCVTLWQVNLIDTSHGGNSGETTVPYNLVGSGYGDISPEIGVTGTPVIDPGQWALYVVSKSVAPRQTTFYQRLHAINITSGAKAPVRQYYCWHLPWYR